MRRMVVRIGGGVLITLLVVGLATGVGTAQSVDSGTNASFGAEISSFMQASGAETQDELGDGMFDAALNRTTDQEERRALVEERKQRLEERHEELRTQRDTLDGEPTVRTYAIATRVAVGADGLERSVNNTEKAAMEVGVDTERLGAIRSNTSELQSADIVGLAHGIDGSTAESVRGPFDEAPAEKRSGIIQTSEENPMPTESAANRPWIGDVGEAERAEPAGESGDVDVSSTDPPDESDRGSPPETGETGAENASEPG